MARLFYWFPICVLTCISSIVALSASSEWKDKDTGKIWLEIGSLSFVDAKKKCEELVTGPYDDWQLASINELERLVTVIREQKQRCPFRTNYFYWSDNGEARLLATGETSTHPYVSSARALCVRQGSIGEFGCRREDERFITYQGGCFDRESRWVWGRQTPSPMSYEKGSEFCRSLSKTEGEWSLPPLSSLVAISGYFVRNNINLSHDWYWSSEIFSGNALRLEQLIQKENGILSFWFSLVPHYSRSVDVSSGRVYRKLAFNTVKGSGQVTSFISNVQTAWVVCVKAVAGKGREERDASR